MKFSMKFSIKNYILVRNSKTTVLQKYAINVVLIWSEIMEVSRK